MLEQKRKASCEDILKSLTKKRNLKDSEVVYILAGASSRLYDDANFFYFVKYYTTYYKKRPIYARPGSHCPGAFYIKPRAWVIFYNH